MVFKSYLLFGSALLFQAIVAQNSDFYNAEALYNIGPSYSLPGNTPNYNGLNYATNGLAGNSLGLAGNGLGLGGNSLGLAGNGLSFSGNGLGLAGNGIGVSKLGNLGSNSGLTNGGGFQVYTTSPSAPTGISTYSELAIEGPLTLSGNLPLIATVGLEGQLPTTGQASTTYSCGNDNVGITSQLGNGSPANYGAGFPNSLGYAGPANIGAGRII